MEILERKKIKVKPIVRPRPFFKKGHDGEFLYTGCKRTYGLPYSSIKRSFFNPFKDELEQTFFEKKLNQKEGALSLYDINSKFWGKFNFTMDKEIFELDLMNPSHALIYRIMLVNPKFANNIDSKDNPECEYIIVDELHEEKAITAKAEIKDKAMDFMYKLKKSKSKMFDTLRLLGKKPDKDATLSWYKTELYKVLDQDGNTPGVLGINDFIRIIEDPMSEVKIFVLNAIDEGDIVQSIEGYRIADGREFIGKDLQNVYDYFNRNEPDIKEKIQIIKQRLKRE